MTKVCKLGEQKLISDSLKKYNLFLPLSNIQAKKKGKQWISDNAIWCKDNVKIKKSRWNGEYQIMQYDNAIYSVIGIPNKDGGAGGPDVLTFPLIQYFNNISPCGYSFVMVGDILILFLIQYFNNISPCAYSFVRVGNILILFLIL